MSKFIKKTAAEFEAMTAEEQTAYLTAKEAHDAQVLKDTAEQAGKDAAEKAIKELPAGVTKEDFNKFEAETKAALDNLGKATGNKTENPMTNIAKQFDEQYKERTKDLDKTQLLEGNITMKAWSSEDTMTATSVSDTTYPEDGTTSVFGAGVLGFFTRLIPAFFRKPKPISKIYDFVTVIPTEGETSVTVISEELIGEAELVDECELKPIVRAEYKATTVEMQFVAVFWKISRLLLRVFKRMGVDLQKRFNQLILDKIPSAILDAVKAAATPFTAVPSLAVHTAPNNFDAAVAVVAYLETLGYTPNAIMLHPYAYANMLTLKAASDGHYMLSNGGSIKIVGSTIDYGGTPIQLVKDPELGVDDVVIGDLTVVQAHVDGNIEYHQGYNDNDDLRRNLVGNVLEQLVAIVIPEGAETAIVSDTFANIKNLITEEVGG